MECGGSQICEHGRLLSVCEECGGRADVKTTIWRPNVRVTLDEYGEVEDTEQEGEELTKKGRIGVRIGNPGGIIPTKCGGSKICEHGRRRSQCKECGGASICEHGRIRSHCKECGGASVCVHGRERSRCKECGGVSICEHGRERSQCKECGGSKICVHGRRRSQCTECGGGAICVHGRRRYRCKECKK